jgi:hypothetical protein
MGCRRIPGSGDRSSRYRRVYVAAQHDELSAVEGKMSLNIES